jgi:uncharacterized membrane protein YccC
MAFAPRTAIPFAVMIGLLFWVGVLLDSSGQLTMPGTDSILYGAAVAGVAAVLAYRDRSESSSAKKRRNGAGYKGGRDNVARRS